MSILLYCIVLYIPIQDLSLFFADHGLQQPVFYYLLQKAWTRRFGGMLFNYYALFSWLTRVKVRRELGKIKNLNWWVAMFQFFS